MSGEKRFYPCAKFVPYRKSCTRTHSREIPTASDAPPRPTSRGFLHWRLSDDGPGASRIVPIGRHPKPFTSTEVRRRLSWSVTASGANVVLVPVRHSRIRFPSSLNSSPREEVERQARTRVRNGLSGESGRTTTLRVEASSESTAI